MHRKEMFSQDMKPSADTSGTTSWWPAGSVLPFSLLPPPQQDLGRHHLLPHTLGFGAQRQVAMLVDFYVAWQYPWPF